MVKLLVIRVKVRFIFSLLALLGIPAGAQEFSYGGHVKYQYSETSLPAQSALAAFGPQSPYQNDFDARFYLEKREASFSFGIHGEIYATQGSGYQAQQLLGRSESTFPSLVGTRQNERSLFDFTTEFAEETDGEMIGNVDRFFFSKHWDQLSVTLGRHALTIGNSLSFPVLDVFNPFNPAAVDKEYKSGTDMITALYGLRGGDNVSLIFVPRRSLDSGDVEASQSSLVLKYHNRLDQMLLDFDVLIAYHYDEPLVGAGFAYEALGAVWRSDSSLQFLQSGGVAISFSAGVDRSWILFGRNFYGFLEFYGNSLGASGSHYDRLDEDLVERLERDEVFTLGRSYVSQGLQVEVTPLYNVFINHFYNLEDQSGLFQVRTPYSISDDLDLIAGLTTGYGGTGTEFGGFTLPGQSFTVGGGTTMYLRFQYYY
ncbi:MAG: hypothetical protein KDD62_08740 [Bdellovibrionales bacterium]|nr:hypothetical protein [Bdellovibrionales bacterium]